MTGARLFEQVAAFIRRAWELGWRLREKEAVEVRVRDLDTALHDACEKGAEAQVQAEVAERVVAKIRALLQPDGHIVFEHKFSQGDRTYVAELDHLNDGIWEWRLSIAHGQASFTGLTHGSDENEMAARGALGAAIDAIVPGESTKLPKTEIYDDQQNAVPNTRSHRC